MLAPAQVLSNYGVESSPAIAVMSRLFGGTLLAMAFILWCARDFRDETALRAVLIGKGDAGDKSARLICQDPRGGDRP